MFCHVLLWFSAVLFSQIFHGYRQISNTRSTLAGNAIVDHPDAFGASPVGAAPTTSGFNRLRKDNCKTRRETLKFWNLV